jgi:putative multiple sugar transport system permease protein
MKGQTKAPFPKEFQLIASGYIPDPFGGITIGRTTLHILTVLIGLVITAFIVISEIRKRKQGTVSDSKKEHGPITGCN